MRSYTAERVERHFQIATVGPHAPAHLLRVESPVITFIEVNHLLKRRWSYIEHP
jgi:hypothetical protein